MFFNENENNDVKMVIPSDIANHIIVAISIKIIAFRYSSNMFSFNHHQRTLSFHTKDKQNPKSTFSRLGKTFLALFFVYDIMYRHY